MVHHFKSENEELQFLMYILGCIPEGVLLENKRFAYFDELASKSATWIISKFYRFAAIGGVIKAPILYQDFPKVKSIFTPGVANRLAVVTMWTTKMMLCEASSPFGYQLLDNVKIHKYTKFKQNIPCGPEL